jgi:hypothetical protein
MRICLNIDKYVIENLKNQYLSHLKKIYLGYISLPYSGQYICRGGDMCAVAQGIRKILTNFT